MICMSLDTTLMFCSACLYVSVRRKTGSDCECVEAYQRILETTGGKKPWQEAASRGQQWDWGGNGARSGGRNVRWWRNFHLCSLILHQQMIYFSPCRSLCPWESPPPPSSPLQTGLYLDTHQGIWHHVFFSSSLWLLSPSGEAVEVFVITRLSKMGDGHGCKAMEWNSGRTLGDRPAEFDSG